MNAASTISRWLAGRKRAYVGSSDEDLRAWCRRAFRRAGWSVTLGWMELDLIGLRDGALPLCVMCRHDPVTEACLRSVAGFASRHRLTLHLVVAELPERAVVEAAAERRVIVEVAEAFERNLHPAPHSGAADASSAPPPAADNPPGLEPDPALHPAPQPPPAPTRVKNDAVTRLIHEDSFVEIWLRDVPGDMTLVTFSPIGLYADGHFYWGRVIADRLGLRCVGVVSKGDTWYPRASLDPLIASRPDLFQGRVVLYGSSMGGYAALKYAAALGADAVVAFSPQISISPDDLPGTPFARFHDPALHCAMRVEHADLSGHVFIFYDDAHREDRRQVELLEPAGRATLIPVLGAGHATVEMTAGAERTQSLLRLALEGDAAGIRRLVRAAKRSNRRHQRNLARDLVGRGKFRWAAAIATASGVDIDGASHRNEVLRRTADYLEGRGQFREAVVAIETAMRTFGADEHLHLRLGGLLIRAGDFSAAILAFQDAIAFSPARQAMYHGYVHALRMTGRRAEGRPVLERAIALCPADPVLPQLLALLAD